MDLQPALKIMEKRVNEGTPTSEIYKELKEKISKFKILNFTLWILLLILFIRQGFEAFLIFSNFDSANIPWAVMSGYLTHIIGPILLLYVLFKIHKFRWRLYFLILIFGMFGLIWSDYGSTQLWWVFNSPLIVSMIISFIIMRNAFPYRKFAKDSDTTRLEKELLGNLDDDV